MTTTLRQARPGPVAGPDSGGRTPRATAAVAGAARAPIPRAAPLVVLLVGLLAAGCTPTSEPAPAPSGTATTASPTTEPAPSEAVPTPDEDSAVGELAEGFPADLLPVPSGAEVLVSTWAPRGEEGAGQPYDVSLNVRSDLPVADLVAVYRTSLVAAGFTETVGTPTAGLAAESTYSRSAAAELVTVGVLDRDGVRTVTVGGTVRASG